MKKNLVSMFLLSASIFAYSQNDSITNTEVLQMKKNGLSDEVIKTKIMTSRTNFDVSPETLILLKNEKLSDELINLMIFKSSNIKSEGLNGAEHLITSINQVNDQLEIKTISKSFVLTKSDEIEIFLPANGQDFLFITQKKLINAKLLGKVADVVGTSAMAVGLGSGSVNALSKANEVMNKANAVRYGSDALQNIQDLPISKTAKKIAGKSLKILSWDFQSKEECLVTAEYENKKYIINLYNAVLSGEVKL